MRDGSEHLEANRAVLGMELGADPRHVTELLRSSTWKSASQRRRQDKDWTTGRWTGSRPPRGKPEVPQWHHERCFFGSGSTRRSWNCEDAGASNEQAQGRPRWTVEEISPMRGGIEPDGHRFAGSRMHETHTWTF